MSRITHLSADDYARSPDCYVETNTGSHFRVDVPRFELDVISHSLANICRFNGHCRQFYSVAEHSILVAVLMSKLKLGDPREGLLHDATEAYMTDVPSPWKPLFQDWRVMDKYLEREMRKQLGLPGDAKTEGCDKADQLALFIEAWYLMPSRGDDYLDPMNLRPTARRLIDEGYGIARLLPPEAYDRFQKALETFK